MPDFAVFFTAFSTVCAKPYLVHQFITEWIKKIGETVFNDFLLRLVEEEKQEAPLVFWVLRTALGQRHGKSFDALLQAFALELDRVETIVESLDPEMRDFVVDHIAILSRFNSLFFDALIDSMVRGRSDMSRVAAGLIKRAIQYDKEDLLALTNPKLVPALAHTTYSEDDDTARYAYESLESLHIQHEPFFYSQFRNIIFGDFEWTDEDQAFAIRKRAIKFFGEFADADSVREFFGDFLDRAGAAKRSKIAMLATVLGRGISSVYRLEYMLKLLTDIRDQIDSKDA